MSDEDYTQGIASVFANPQDVARYREAIQSGASEREALNVGDNGVGAWGDDTTSTEDPIVSLPPDTPGFGRNKLVEIEGPRGKVVARIADKMPETAHLKGKANIDLNPAAAIAVGHPGGVTPVKWKFVNNEPQSNFLGDPSSLALGSGDLSAADIPAAPPGTPTVNPIPGVPHGISSLTPIGDPNAETVDATTTADPNEDVASAIEDAQDASLISGSNAQSETTLPAPDVRGLKRTIDQKTGAVVFGDPNSTSSIRYFPDDHAEMMVGSQKWVMMPGQNKFVAAPKSRHQIIQFSDSATHEPYQALVDMDTGEQIKRYDDPTTRSAAQAEQLRLRILNLAKSQPGIQAYVNIKNNYDSLAQNAAIPEDQRTPADDAAAIQAFGSVEHPGTGVTDADKKQSEALVGKLTSLKLWAKNWTTNSARVLDAKTVSDMRNTAKRALDGRQKTYNDEVQPLLDEAKRLNLSPAQVNGALGANIMPAEQKQEATKPAHPQANQFLDWAKRHPQDPSAQVILRNAAAQ